MYRSTTASLAAGLVALALQSSPVRAEPVTLTFWTIDKPDQAQQSYVLAHEFETKNPDIRIAVKHVDFADISNDAIRAVANRQRARPGLDRQSRSGIVRLARRLCRPDADDQGIEDHRPRPLLPRTARVRHLEGRDLCVATRVQSRSRCI